MAYELPVCGGDFTFGEAAADYSTAGQYKWVKLTGTGIAGADTVTVCDADGEMAVGVLQNNPRAGEAASVRYLGITKLIVATSEALVRGDFVGTTTAGTATKVQETATGADVTDNILGIALETVTGTSPAAAVITVLIRPLGRVVS